MNKAYGMAAVLALIVAVTSPPAVAATTNIAGTWIVTLDFITSKATIEATIKQNDDKVEAQVSTPAGHLDFNGTLVDNKISAVYTLPIQGTALEVRLNGIVDADTLSGTIAFGPGQEVKWTAVRKPVAGVSETAGATPTLESTDETVLGVPK